MFKGFLLLSLLLFPLFCLASAPAENRFDLSLGVVDADGETGANLTAGFSHTKKSFRLNIHFMDLNTFSREPEGFHEETLSNGNVVCRNESNGYFSDKENCTETEYDYGLSAEIGYFSRDGNPMFWGAGYRISGDDDLGGNNISYLVGQVFTQTGKYYTKIKLSSDYKSLNFGVVF